MSLQPPGGGQAGGEMPGPGAAGGGPDALGQPQDPWSGYEPGLASMPTDPIPQPGSAYPPPSVWSQPTVVHGASPVAAPPQFPYQPPTKRNGAAVISIVVVLVLVLGGGGAYAAYHYISTHPSNSSRSTPPPSTGTTSPSAVFPYTAKVGDCVINVGTQSRPKMAPSPCSAAGSYTIVKIAKGASIPVGPKDTFDTDTTSAQVCAGIDFDTWYGYQVDDPNLNLFFCMTNN